ncbi:hypothetical protein AAC387_Pa05g2681 [Persea americana]
MHVRSENKEVENEKAIKKKIEFLAPLSALDSAHANRSYRISSDLGVRIYYRPQILIPVFVTSDSRFYFSRDWFCSVMIVVVWC